MAGGEDKTGNDLLGGVLDSSRRHDECLLQEKRQKVFDSLPLCIASINARYCGSLVNATLKSSPLEDLRNWYSLEFEGLLRQLCIYKIAAASDEKEVL